MYGEQVELCRPHLPLAVLHLGPKSSAGFSSLCPPTLHRHLLSLSSGTRRNLRNDLLVAADSITNTMSSLVKELHSGETQGSPLASIPFLHALAHLTSSLHWQKVITGTHCHFTAQFCIPGTQVIFTQRGSLPPVITEGQLHI
jgi:hypothetical protein